VRASAHYGVRCVAGTNTLLFFRGCFRRTEGKLTPIKANSDTTRSISVTNWGKKSLRRNPFRTREEEAMEVQTSYRGVDQRG